MAKLHRWVLCSLLLLCLAAAASAEGPGELLNRAYAEAQKLRDPGQRALALADLAVAWQADQDPRWETLLKEALAAGDEVEEGVSRPLVWRGLMVRAWGLAPERARELLEKALKAANGLTYFAHRSMVLREIGRSLLPLDRAGAEAALGDAAAAAAKLEAPIFRASARRDLAVAFAPLSLARAAELFSQAAADLASIQPADEPVQLARIELIVAWSETDLPAALKEAETIPDERMREVGYRRVCEALAVINPDGALEVAGELRDGGQRALALVAIASHLPSARAETAAAMARAALQAGASLPAEDLARLQCEAAVALARTDLEAGLTLAKQIADPAVTARSLGWIALHLAERDPAGAAKVAGAIEDWDERESYQAQLAPYLARTDLPAALTMIDGLLSRRARLQALLSTARELGAPKQP